MAKRARVKVQNRIGDGELIKAAYLAAVAETEDERLRDKALRAALHSVDVKLRSFAGDEHLWERLLLDWRAGRLAKRASDSAAYREREDIERAAWAMADRHRSSGSVEESLEEIARALNRTSETPPADLHSMHALRTRVAYESFLATQHYEEFSEAFLAGNLQAESRARTRHRLYSSLVVLGFVTAFYGFAVDSLSAGDVAERLRVITQDVRELTNLAPTPGDRSRDVHAPEPGDRPDAGEGPQTPSPAASDGDLGGTFTRLREGPEPYP